MNKKCLPFFRQCCQIKVEYVFFPVSTVLTVFLYIHVCPFPHTNLQDGHIISKVFVIIHFFNARNRTKETKNERDKRKETQDQGDKTSW